MKIAALDVGDVRIGVAVSDVMEILASGVEVYTRTTLERDCAYLANRLRELGAKRLVIGLPKNMNGTEGPAVEKVRAFAEMLGKYTDIPMVFVDERMTTMIAQRVLIGANVSRKKRKGVVDKLAAQVILQSYLDAKAGERDDRI